MKNRKGAVYIEYIITFLIAGFAIVAVVHIISEASEKRGTVSNDSKKNPVPCGEGGVFSNTSNECF